MFSSPPSSSTTTNQNSITSPSSVPPTSTTITKTLCDFVISKYQEPQNESLPSSSSSSASSSFIAPHSDFLPSKNKSILDREEQHQDATSSKMTEMISSRAATSAQIAAALFKIHSSRISEMRVNRTKMKLILQQQQQISSSSSSTKKDFMVAAEELLLGGGFDEHHSHLSQQRQRQQQQQQEQQQNSTRNDFNNDASDDARRLDFTATTIMNKTTTNIKEKENSKNFNPNSVALLSPGKLFPEFLPLMEKVPCYYQTSTISSNNNKNSNSNIQFTELNQALAAAKSLYHSTMLGSLITPSLIYANFSTWCVFLTNSFGDNINIGTSSSSSSSLSSAVKANTILKMSLILFLLECSQILCESPVLFHSSSSLAISNRVSSNGSASENSCSNSKNANSNIINSNNNNHDDGTAQKKLVTELNRLTKAIVQMAVRTQQTVASAGKKISSSSANASSLHRRTVSSSSPIMMSPTKNTLHEYNSNNNNNYPIDESEESNTVEFTSLAQNDDTTSTPPTAQVAAVATSPMKEKSATSRFKNWIFGSNNNNSNNSASASSSATKPTTTTSSSSLIEAPLGFFNGLPVTIQDFEDQHDASHLLSIAADSLCRISFVLEVLARKASENNSSSTSGVVDAVNELGFVLNLHCLAPAIKNLVKIQRETMKIVKMGHLF